MKDISFYEKSSEWRRSLGKGLFKVHFREKEGKGHAVCGRKEGSCKVHYDNHNPHESFFRHIWEDSPEFIFQTFGVLALSVTAGKLLSSSKKSS